jgi:hypothetical protein
MNDSNRLRRYGLPYEGLHHILNGTAGVTRSQLPDDATYHAVQNDRESLQFSVFVRSEKFEAVPDGEIIPYAGLLPVRFHRP